MADYVSKQVAVWGLAFAGTLTVVGGGSALIFLPSGPSAAILATLVLIAVILTNFAILTVRVTDTEVRWRFVWLFRQSAPLADLRQVEVRRSPWYWGWGLRWTPNGWLWRSAGLDDVWLELSDGKQVGIGSPDPEGLSRAICERAQLTCDVDPSDAASDQAR